MATTAVRKLSDLAVREGGTVHWEQDTSREETGDADDVWRPPYTRSRSVDIEMTAYALLVYSHNQDIDHAVPIAKWIISQRNPNGGFSSTQDTVIALQALAAFASLTVMPAGQSGGIQLTATYGSDTHRFAQITRENALLLQTVQLPATIDSVRVNATGQGTALVQLNVKYNLLAVNNAGVRLRMTTNEHNDVISLRTCAKWTKQDQPSGMVVMEVGQLTGYSAVDLSEARRQVGDALKRVEDEGDKMVLYFDELTTRETCLTLTSEKTQLVGKVQKAPVKIYSYYDPDASDTQFYGLPEASTRTNFCDYCKECCDTGAQTVATTQLVITFTVAALLSYLLLV